MASSKPGPIALPTSGQCPVCQGAADAHYRPFCSRRCADIDLSRWLRGAYVIAGGNNDADEDGDDVAASHQTASQQKDADNEDA